MFDIIKWVDCPNCGKQVQQWYFNDHLALEHLQRVLLCECRTSDKECCSCQTKADCRLKHSCCCSVDGSVKS